MTDTSGRELVVGACAPSLIESSRCVPGPSRARSARVVGPRGSHRGDSPARSAAGLRPRRRRSRWLRLPPASLPATNLTSALHPRDFRERPLVAPPGHADAVPRPAALQLDLTHVPVLGRRRRPGHRGRRRPARRRDRRPARRDHDRAHARAARARTSSSTSSTPSPTSIPPSTSDGSPAATSSTATSASTCWATCPPMDVALDRRRPQLVHGLQRAAPARRRCPRAGAPLPVLVLHDVGWPYGRRDLYYDPRTSRQSTASRGAGPGCAGAERAARRRRPEPEPGQRRASRAAPATA